MRAWVLSLGVAVTLLVSPGLAPADEAGEAGATDVGRARIAILPMVVNTSGENAYLRSGLSDMLASRLGRNPALAVIPIEDESLATTDPQRAAAIAIEHGARYAVFGSFTQFGEGASLDVQCLEATAFGEDEDPRARRVFIQSGTVGEIIPKLDATAGKISLFVAGSVQPEDDDLPAVAASPKAAPQPAPSAANEAALEDLRRRLGAIEDYLFGRGDSETTAEAPGEEPSQDLRLR